VAINRSAASAKVCGSAEPAADIRYLLRIGAVTIIGPIWPGEPTDFLTIWGSH
jgi:hypothetical protein